MSPVERWHKTDRPETQKNNTRDSNVVPHRSTNLARQCLTSLSRREAVLSLWYGRSWHKDKIKIYKPQYLREGQDREGDPIPKI